MRKLGLMNVGSTLTPPPFDKAPPTSRGASSRGVWAARPGWPAAAAAVAPRSQLCEFYANSELVQVVTKWLSLQLREGPTCAGDCIKYDKADTGCVCVAANLGQSIGRCPLLKICLACALKTSGSNIV